MATEEPAPTFGGAAYSDKLGTLVGADGSPVELRRQCLEVFHCLAATPDTLVRKEDIVSAVWEQVAVTDDSLTQCISEIRKALGDTERRILKTLPRRGYRLVSDPPTTTTAATAATATATDAAAAGTVKYGKSPQPKKIVTLPRLFASGVLVMLAVASIPEPADKPVNAQQTDTPALAQSAADDTPTLSLVDLKAPGSTTVSPDARTLIAELRVALSRYRTMRLAEEEEADYRLTLNIDDLGSQPSRLFAELEHTGDQSILFGRAYDVEAAAQPLRDLGVRIAAAVASPGVGAISEHLLESSRIKPIEQITRAGCYANGFGCVKCSGEEDTITRRAEACLACLLERHPEDARAWALQATIHAHHYLWANTLPEPERSTPALRQHLSAARGRRCQQGRGPVRR
jgi:DNA-binding winged helix-turn-helix (wHTH) protein